MLPSDIINIVMLHKEFIENVLPAVFPKQQKVYSVWIEYMEKYEKF